MDRPALKPSPLATQPDTGDASTEADRGASAVWPLVALVIVLAGWIAFRWYTGVMPEGALVTCRYAENLAQGEGFVFNPGEKVLGTNTPLFTLLLSLGGLIAGVPHIPLIAGVLAIVAAAVAVLCAYALLRTAQVGPRWSAFAVVVLGAHPAVLWTTAGGTEAPIVLCFMTASLLAVVRTRWTVALVLAALLALTRADGLLWAVLIALAVVWQAGRASITPLVVFVLLVGGWIGFATVYFGSPVPQPATAAHVFDLKDAAARAPLAEMRAYANWFLENLWLPYTYGFARHQVWAWLVCLVLGALGIARRELPLQPLIVIAAFLLIFCIACYVARVPTLPACATMLTWSSLLLGVLGLWELWVLFDLYWRKFNLQPWVLAAASVMVTVLVAVSLANRDLVEFRRQRDDQARRNALHRALAEWLTAHTQPGDVIATAHIGYEGYFSKRRLLDLTGRVSPQVVDIMRCSASRAESLEQVLIELAPPYVVLPSAYVLCAGCERGTALDDLPEDQAWFGAAYAAVKELRATQTESPACNQAVWLTVYRLRQGPVVAADNPALR